jgi:hypothetical protein
MCIPNPLTSRTANDGAAMPGHGDVNTRKTTTASTGEFGKITAIPAPKQTQIAACTWRQPFTIIGIQIMTKALKAAP